jgi:hypothetical protein
MEKKKNKKWEEMTPKEKRKGCIISIVVLVFVVCFVWFINIMQGDQNKREYEDLSINVQILANDFLKPQLKYPDEWKYNYKKVIREDSTLYTFQSVILAKNDFGVSSRLYWLLQMRFIGSKEDSHKNSTDLNNWTVIRNELTE